MARFLNNTGKVGGYDGFDTLYAVQGGTLGTQPTFNGNPLFTASYILTGDLVNFRINVDFDNITSFGTGTYYMTVPFSAKYDTYIRGGHLADISTSKKYAISGNLPAGDNKIYLTTTASNGDEVAFTSSVPFNLAIADDFHIAGTYIKA